MCKGVALHYISKARTYCSMETCCQFIKNQEWKRPNAFSDTIHWTSKSLQSNVPSKTCVVFCWSWIFFLNRYTINDRNLGRLLSQITTTYNTELQLWKVCTTFSYFGCHYSDILVSFKLITFNMFDFKLVFLYFFWVINTPSRPERWLRTLAVVSLYYATVEYNSDKFSQQGKLIKRFIEACQTPQET